MLRERQCHRVTRKKHCVARARPRSGDGELSFTQIDALDFDWRASFGNERRKGPRSASDVEPSQVGRWRKPREERFSRKPAPRGHSPLVSVSILEADVLHLRNPSPFIAWHVVSAP
jgi:hypothetical protein